MVSRCGPHRAFLDIKLVTAHGSVIYSSCLHTAPDFSRAEWANINKRFGSNSPFSHAKLVPASMPVINVTRAHAGGNSAFTERAYISVLSFFLFLSNFFALTCVGLRRCDRASQCIRPFTLHRRPFALHRRGVSGFAMAALDNACRKFFGCRRCHDEPLLFGSAFVFGLRCVFVTFLLTSFAFGQRVLHNSGTITSGTICLQVVPGPCARPVASTLALRPRHGFLEALRLMTWHQQWAKARRHRRIKMRRCYQYISLTTLPEYFSHIKGSIGPVFTVCIVLNV